MDTGGVVAPLTLLAVSRVACFHLPKVSIRISISQVRGTLCIRGAMRDLPDVVGGNKCAAILTISVPGGIDPPVLRFVTRYLQPILSQPESRGNRIWNRRLVASIFAIGRLSIPALPAAILARSPDGHQASSNRSSPRGPVPAIFVTE